MSSMKSFEAWAKLAILLCNCLLYRRNNVELVAQCIVIFLTYCFTECRFLYLALLGPEDTVKGFKPKGSWV